MNVWFNLRTGIITEEKGKMKSRDEEHRNYLEFFLKPSNFFANNDVIHYIYIGQEHFEMQCMHQNFCVFTEEMTHFVLSPFTQAYKFIQLSTGFDSPRYVK